MSTSNERLLDSAVALAAITAFLYACGTAKFGGFSSTLLLDENMLDRNFHQVLYSGFLASLGPAFRVALIFLGGSYLYSHLILPSIVDWVRGSVRAKRRFIKVREFMFGKRKDSLLEQRAKSRTTRAGFFIVILLLLLIAMVQIEKSGVREAEKIIANLTEGNAKPSEFIEVNIDGKMVRLLYLACGSRNCAAIDPETKRVTYFPQQVHSYELAIKKSSDANHASGQ